MTTLSVEQIEAVENYVAASEMLFSLDMIAAPKILEDELFICERDFIAKRNGNVLPKYMQSLHAQRNIFHKTMFFTNNNALLSFMHVIAYEIAIDYQGVCQCQYCDQDKIIFNYPYALWPRADRAVYTDIVQWMKFPNAWYTYIIVKDGPTLIANHPNSREYVEKIAAEANPAWLYALNWDTFDSVEDAKQFIDRAISKMSPTTGLRTKAAVDPHADTSIKCLLNSE